MPQAGANTIKILGTASVRGPWSDGITGNGSANLANGGTKNGTAACERY